MTALLASSVLVVVFSLRDFFVLSLYFDFVFAGAAVLLWWIKGGRLSSAIGAVLSVFVGYWLVGKTGPELLSVAGLFFLAYFAFVGFVAVVMTWDGRWVMVSLTASSLLVGVALQSLDYSCGVHHWSVASIKLQC